jgi:hypothetical protein
VWNRNHQGVALGEFLALLRENKARIQRSDGN